LHAANAPSLAKEVPNSGALAACYQFVNFGKTSYSSANPLPEISLNSNHPALQFWAKTAKWETPSEAS
jgi:hypothetical protein